jgi:Protein kinase domain
VCMLRSALDTREQSLAEPGDSAPHPASPSGRILHDFGDKELQEEIARGGMGLVFRARQVSLNRTVALKMILTGRLAKETEVKRFQAEAEAVARLQHPNIVAIHEVGVHEGQHYFSMDFVAGKDLATLVRENPLPPSTAARYVKTIAQATHYAHQQGVLHRDLKPSASSAWKRTPPATTPPPRNWPWSCTGFSGESQCWRGP